MDRSINSHLIQWQQSAHRKPLILRGARQVGKTHVVRDFANKRFSQFVEVNFELKPELKDIFSTLDATSIVRNLNLVLGTKIESGSTLVFFDEIQECPRAITALRYFYEQLPGLHVIAAGSLLEFALEAEDVSVPVGRVEYAYLHPMTFGEFLLASGHENLKRHLDEVTVASGLHETVHCKLTELFRNYLLVGGMPEAVQVHLEDPTAFKFQDMQLSLIQTYRDDFGKYASKAKIHHLQKVFNTAPAMVGQIYKYSHVNPDAQSRDLKEALHLLTQAGVLTKVAATSAQGLPLIKDVQEKKFKILFLDVGLMQRSLGLNAQIALAKDFLAVNSGAIAEQAVGQELLGCRSPLETPEAFFWARDKKSSQAKVDFLTMLQGKIIPIEVKSGKTGALKSLRLFLAEHSSPFGIRFSQHPLSFHDQVLSLPIYMVEQMPRIAESVYSQGGTS